MRFYFITVLWGKEFTELYLDTVLPTQLSPGNLPSLKEYTDSKYIIYTTENDYNTINKYPRFSDLKEIIKVELFFINNPETNKKHQIMTECHNHAIKHAKEDDAILVFLAPDAIFSEGTFCNLLKYVKDGKRAVMIAGLRVTKETFVPELKKKYFLKNFESPILSGRELVRLAIENLHPISKCLIWNGKCKSFWPSHIYWHIHGKGILVRGFHLHPLMVKPSLECTNIVSTVDGDFLMSACPDIKDIHVVTDSDEMMCVEISPISQTAPERKSMSPFNIALWAYKHTTRYHREFFLYKILFHLDSDRSSWKKYEKGSDRVVNRIIFYLKYGKIFFSVSLYLKKITKKILLKIIGTKKLDQIRKITLKYRNWQFDAFI